MENMWLVFFWTGPIGIGVFLALLGAFVYLLAKAGEIRKRTPGKRCPNTRFGFIETAPTPARFAISSRWPRW